MLAVLGPGLRQRLQLDVGGSCAKTHLLALLPHGGVAVVGLDDLHLVQGERQHAVAADAHQFLVGDLQVDRVHLDLRLHLHLGDEGGHAALGLEAGGVQDLVALDQGVAQKSGGDPLGVRLGEGA